MSHASASGIAACSDVESLSGSGVMQAKAILNDTRMEKAKQIVFIKSLYALAISLFWNMYFLVA
ncbi:hypothetical protein D3C81_2317310 [compost metagenome]